MQTITPVVINELKVPVFNEEVLRKYWKVSLPEKLEDDETIRVVPQLRDNSSSDRKDLYYTEKRPVRTADDVMNILNELQTNNPNKIAGISISTAVLKYTGDAPKIENFKYTKAIAIDIDTHIGNTKERYRLGGIEEDHIRFAAIHAWVEISNKLSSFGIGPVIPKFAALTGGGLQFILEFERELNKSEAQKLFGLLKNAIGNLKWQTPLKDPYLGNHPPVDFDIDKSFADIIHVQRCAGTVNQKYGLYSKEVDVFNMTSDEIFNLSLRLQAGIEETGYTDSQKNTYKTVVTKIFEGFKEYSKLDLHLINVDDNLITAKLQGGKPTINQGELKNIEQDLLHKIKQKGINTVDLIRGDVNIGPISGNLVRLFCPFHEERNPSMALYVNEVFDVFKDFHDDTTYTLVTFWQKLHNVSKSTAISQIAEIAGITLGKGERKDFQNLELAEIVDELLKRIDQNDFVYYRLANKNRTCIVRHIDTGEAYVFDGPKMLANHILQNQLGIDDAEEQLVYEFAKRFQERVLIDAFEEFFPGRPTVFNKQFIQFVNLWVPSDKYKRVHARVDEINETSEKPFSLEESKELIKRKCPWTYKYILQIVQNGDLTWFFNWLSGVSKFKPMPTVPVVFGVQGAGKNLFINTVMDFYLNNEYVRVVSGDRIMQQFNSMLESTNLLVLDEGDFSTGKEVDQLKLLTGNDKILIEKKGVDATNKTRHFNIMFFSNGEVPLRHPAMDRRITYFNNEIPLLASVEAWNTTIDEMVERVKSEMVEFWAIIFKTELDHKMAMANSKNGQFWKQILMQHPFGALIVKLMNNEWEDIALQLNENVQDPAEMKVNLGLLKTIKEQFENNGKISLTLINRYIQSLNYRMKQSIQKFIQTNHLHEFGISVIVEEEDVKIQVNKNKVRESLKVENVLRRAYPKTAKEEVSGLEAELAMENADAGVEAEQAVETFAQEEQLLYGSKPTGIKPPPPPPGD